MLLLILSCFAYLGTTEHIQCDQGKYGENCSLNCSTNCLPHINGALYCNRSTGGCSEGCIRGFYTSFCNASCQNCSQIVCDFLDGSCISNGEDRSSEKKPCEQQSSEHHCERGVTWPIIAVIALSVILIGASIAVWRLRNRRGNTDANTEGQHRDILLP